MRASGLFVIAPVLGERQIPRLVKAGLLILLSMLLMSSLSTQAVPVAGSVWQLAGLAVKELLIGLIIGLIFKLLFIGVFTAGSIAGYQMGFAIVTVYDKNLSNQVSILGRFWNLLAVLIFLTIDGHHLVVSALANSYTVIPPGGMGQGAAVGEMVIKYTAYLFVIGLKIAAPVMITLFLTDVALGTIAKTMPTMNVFFVGFPIKIAAGLLVMGMSLPIFAYVLKQSTAYLDRQMFIIFHALGEA